MAKTDPKKGATTAATGKGKPPRPPAPKRQRGASWAIWGVLLLLLTGGLAFVLYEPTIYAWSVRRLQSDDADEVASAREWIGWVAPYATGKLQEGADASQPVVRRVLSVRALGRWGIPEAVAVAQAAARQDAAPPVTQAGLEALGDLAAMESEDVAGGAMRALHDLLQNAPAAGTPQDAALERATARRIEAVRQLGRVRLEALRAENLQVLARHLQDPVAEIRYVLAGVGVDLFEETYGRLASDDAAVRARVAERLRARGNAREIAGALTACLARDGADAYWVRHRGVGMLRTLSGAPAEERPFDVYAPSAAQVSAWEQWQTSLPDGYAFPEPSAAPE